jgi:bifunctional DNA-binding transcriptional regulator/antitoxin component of YhaV-PrlF toxin-antitoxin module
LRKEVDIPRSTITSKGQTTVPREVRVRLGLAVHDTLEWGIDGNVVRITVAARGFLLRRGSIHVGAGSASDDVRRARSTRGKPS